MLQNGRSTSSLPEKDNKKIALERINLAESYFGELCSVLSSFTKKTARIRDKYDDLGRVLRNFAETENRNESFSEGVINFAKAMTLLGDVKEIEVQRLQAKVVLELASYESLCKNQKDALKHSLSMRDKEAIRQQHLEQMRQRTQQAGGSKKKTPSADLESGKSDRNLVPKSGTDVDELVKRFELQKMQDVKAILLNLTAIQLKQHAKAIELLTAAYQDIAAIDECGDLEAFGEKFTTKDDHQLKPQNRSQSVGALSSPFNASHPKRKSGNLSASTMSVDSPGRHLDKHDEDLSRTTSMESVKESHQDRSGSESSQSGDESNSPTDEDGRHRDDDDEENDSDMSQTKDRRPTVAPVPHVRFSKMAQQQQASAT